MEFLNSLKQILLYAPKSPMLFHTGLFLFCFGGFISIYYLLRNTHYPRIFFVILFSLYFYYKSSGFYFFLLLFSTVTDYYLAREIWRQQNQKHRKNILIISLLLNFGILAYFKYTNFFGELIASVLNQPFYKWDIFLPVGISFFTFQSMSYTIDVYRREIKPIDNLPDYAFFVSFFPQLLAGPIVRARNFIPQIYRPVYVSGDMFSGAVFWILTGLIKKAIISDYISVNFIDRVFENPGLYTGLENLIAVYGYGLQIYCDFSGYSDMATGIALLLGFHFPSNFLSPYQSESITEFWRRWHISLSTWLKDYLYISLGGNRKGTFRTYLNLMITMTLGGLWHGASLRFILWGAMHGASLITDKLLQYLSEWQVPGLSINPLKIILYSPYLSIFRIAVTFHWVCFCWIFFRAKNMGVVSDMIHQIVFEFNGQVLPQFVEGYPVVLWLIFLGYLLHFIPQYFNSLLTDRISRLTLPVIIVLMTIVIFIVYQFQTADIQPFIYFQF
ncbi:MAG: MBOAT family protein [Bacteroidia bacterium]|nr:MBOAT family protein [Bacteroidia bacterium]